MAKIILRQKAIDDLSNIWNYTAIKWSEDQANKYYETLKYACKEIAKKTNIGKPYVEISNQLLGLKTGKHIIFYQLVSADEVEIIRILHQSMDLKKRMIE